VKLQNNSLPVVQNDPAAIGEAHGRPSGSRRWPAAATWSTLNGLCGATPTSVVDLEVGEPPTTADNLAADQREVRGYAPEALFVRVEWIGREYG
jgi:hypothetical protein